MKNVTLVSGSGKVKEISFETIEELSEEAKSFKITISNYAKIGNCCTFYGRTLIGAGATIGDNVTIISSTVSPMAKVGNNSSVGENCFVSPEASIGANTTIERNVVIRDKATIGSEVGIGANSDIGKAIIFDKAYIGREVIVLDGATIGNGSNIMDSSLVCESAAIAADAIISHGSTIPRGCKNVFETVAIAGLAFEDITIIKVGREVESSQYKLFYSGELHQTSSIGSCKFKFTKKNTEYLDFFQKTLYNNNMKKKNLCCKKSKNA